MQREVRASDAERDAVVEMLQHAMGEGRITVTEFEERAQAAYKARTRGDLDVLMADLSHSLW